MSAGAVSYGRAASPVVLKSIGPGRWTGIIDPGEDNFTFYIFAKRAADGSYEAVLRNPEFDLGNQQRVRRLVREGDTLKLMAAAPNGSERELGAGAVSADGFSLQFSGRGGTYDFTRDNEASLAYPRPRPVARYRYRVPPALSDGWKTASLASERVDRPAMERLVQSISDMPMDEQDAPEIHALLIARHGKLLLEE